MISFSDWNKKDKNTDSKAIKKTTRKPTKKATPKTKPKTIDDSEKSQSRKNVATGDSTGSIREPGEEVGGGVNPSLQEGTCS